MKDTDLLFSLLSCQLNGQAAAEDIKTAAKEKIRELYSLAAPQGLGPLLGQTLSDQKILGDDSLSQQIRSKIMHTFAVQTQQEVAYAQICACLEKHKVCYVPLKGAVIRQYYPQSWMRTSCDVDILVKETELDTAAAALKEELGYTQPADREYHDIALFSPKGVILELHFSLKEDNEKLDSVLSQVWDYVEPDTNGPGKRELNKEFFVFHIIAHCAYHFMSSGCGAKPLLDLWLLRHRMGYSEEKVKALCRDAGLEVFYENILNLAECWFAGKEKDASLERLEAYIIGAGFGGSEENAAAAAVLKKGSKGRYILSRIFLPYDVLKEYYPVLNSHRWLMPVYQVRRWFAGLMRNHLGAAVDGIKEASALSDARLKETKDLFSELELFDID